MYVLISSKLKYNDKYHYILLMVLLSYLQAVSKILYFYYIILYSIFKAF